MNKQEVFVITADVIRSKSYDDIESIIKEKLDNINSQFSDTLYTKFTCLKGDEFQAIVEKIHHDKLLKIIRNLKHQMGKHKMRIGIGYGTINRNGNKHGEFGSWEFNGEAFYKARSVMEKLQIKKNNSIQMSTMFNVFEDPIKNEMINLLYFNVDRALAKWKEENWRMTNYLENNMTHEEIMGIMNKESKNNKERVSYTKKINRSDWYLIQEIEKTITILLKEELY